MSETRPETTFAWCCSYEDPKRPGVRVFSPATASRTRSGSQTEAVIRENSRWSQLYFRGWRCQRVSIRAFGSDDGSELRSR